MNAHEAHKVATEARLTKQAVEFHMLNKDIQSLHEKIAKAAQNGKFDIKINFLLKNIKNFLGVKFS